MSKEIVIFVGGVVIALSIGLLLGYSNTTYTEQYNGICWFEIYDEHMTGVSIKVYNFSYLPGGLWKSDCEALKDICLRQGPKSINQTVDGEFSLDTNIPCKWFEPDTCECYPYRR